MKLQQQQWRFIQVNVTCTMIILCINLEHKKFRVFEIAEEWKSNAAYTIFGWIVENNFEKKKKHVENNAKIKQIHAMCEESKQKQNKWINCWAIFNFSLNLSFD